MLISTISAVSALLAAESNLLQHKFAHATHTLLLLHEKLPPAQLSPYWVLISLSIEERSCLSPEALFQCPFVCRRGSVNPVNLAQKKPHMEYFKPVSPAYYRLFLSPVSPFSACWDAPLRGEMKPLSRYFGFSGTKKNPHCMSSPTPHPSFFFFVPENNWLQLCAWTRTRAER